MMLSMKRKIPVRPGHPERICWGCEHFCPADDMRCGNGTERAQHPIELWGEDWARVGLDADAEEQPSADPSQSPARYPRG
jgi:hypothetical protein